METLINMSEYVGRTVPTGPYRETMNDFEISSSDYGKGMTVMVRRWRR